MKNDTYEYENLKRNKYKKLDNQPNYNNENDANGNRKINRKKIIINLINSENSNNNLNTENSNNNTTKEYNTVSTHQNNLSSVDNNNAKIENIHLQVKKSKLIMI